jgi:hypothetical protein
VDGDPRQPALSAHDSDIFLSAYEGGVVAEKMHGRDGHADLERAHPIRD